MWAFVIKHQTAESKKWVLSVLRRQLLQLPVTVSSPAPSQHKTSLGVREQVQANTLT